MKKIKIAIVGIGNCASSLIQGMYFYRNTTKKGSVVGLRYRSLGGYKPSDIKVVAAFDIDMRKVGKDVSEAIFAQPNNTAIFCSKIPLLRVPVFRGPTFDGLPAHMVEFPDESRFIESKENPVDVVAILKQTRPDFVVNYLPVGSQQATEHYANCCLEAGVSLINAIPVFIASNPAWVRLFKQKGLMVLGDDIKAQVGATILHRRLIDTFLKRGAKIDQTYQLNIGGNTDFLNMRNEARVELKRESKVSSIRTLFKGTGGKIYAGPSDYVSFLGDHKIAYIRVEGRIFGGLPVEAELRLSVEDSPNSAGMMIDLIRAAQCARKCGKAGTITELCAFAFKHPLVAVDDDKAEESFDRWVTCL